MRLKSLIRTLCSNATLQGTGVAFVMILFPSCATTRLSQESPCLVNLVKGSNILVAGLPEKNTDFYLDGLEEVYHDLNIETTTVSENEWKLKASGVVDPLNPSNFKNLQAAGFTHLLLVWELSNSSGNKYAYYTSTEMGYEGEHGVYKPAWPDSGNQSEISVQLIPLNDVTARQSIVAKTTIGHLRIRHADKGETRINPTAVEAARYRAIKKAAKFMLKRCTGK